MNKKLTISARQKQILIGKCLGDGHIETANGKTFRVKFMHAGSQKIYIEWLYRELQNLASSAPKRKEQKVGEKMYEKYWFNTNYSGSLRFYAQQFYEGRRKIVPRLIRRWLTPLAFAVWFMDDGSVKSKESRGKYLNTQGFDLTSIHRLQDAIEQNFQITTTLRKQKDGIQIYIPSAHHDRFQSIIDPYVLLSMRYKLG